MVWTSQCRVKVNFQVTCIFDVDIWQVNVGSSEVLGNVHPLVVFKWSFNHVQLQRHKPKIKLMVVAIVVTLPWIWTYILHTSECLLYITIVLLAMYSTEQALLFATNALVLKQSIDVWSLQIGFFLVLCFVFFFRFRLEVVGYFVILSFIVFALFCFVLLVLVFIWKEVYSTFHWNRTVILWVILKSRNKFQLDTKQTDTLIVKWYQ